MGFKKNTSQSVKFARELNKSKRPDGFIYVLKLKGFDLYKIGVSANPKRRIYDIDSHSPFGTEIILLLFFKNVYEMEECIHDSFKLNHKRKEWFEIHPEDIVILKKQLQAFNKKGIYLIPR